MKNQDYFCKVFCSTPTFRNTACIVAQKQINKICVKLQIGMEGKWFDVVKTYHNDDKTILFLQNVFKDEQIDVLSGCADYRTFLKHFRPTTVEKNHELF